LRTCPHRGGVLGKNDCVTLKLRLAALALLAPCLAAAQSFTQSYAVHDAFAAGKYAPLDGPERWQRWRSEDGGSAAIHLDSFAVAAITQAMNVPPQWGRTPLGFGRRVGSEYGGFLIANSVHEGIAAVAGTDPRYFPCACSGFFRRGGHALEMTLLTYNRQGRKTLDMPQLTGQYGGQMISTLWYPPHYSPLVQGVQFGHLEMGLIGTIHLVQEFSPELKRFFHVGAKAAAAAP